MGGSPRASVCPKCGTSKFMGWCDCRPPMHANLSLREEIQKAFQQQQSLQNYKSNIDPYEARLLTEIKRLAKYGGAAQYNPLTQVTPPVPVKECQYCGVEYMADQKAPCDCSKSLMVTCGKCGNKVLRGKTCECRKEPKHD